MDGVLLGAVAQGAWGFAEWDGVPPCPCLGAGSAGSGLLRTVTGACHSVNS